MDNSWVLDASKLQQENLDFVIVTVAKTTGSTPRNEGSKMLITDKEQFGSIGGGKLELEATNLARRMLQIQGNARELKTISLGASLGQCCGGQVTLFLEKQPSETINIALFGGGHVAQSLLLILEQLPYKVTLVESRNEFIPETTQKGTTKKLSAILSEQPEDEVENFLPQTYYLIMTHSHSQDLAICEAILKRKDFAYLGIIGSQKKSSRFQKQLLKKGHSESLIKKIFCPIGLPIKNNKQPIEIAVSVAAQLIEIINNQKKI